MTQANRATPLSYDNQQRVQTKQFGDGGVITYTYNSANRLSKIEDTVSGTIRSVDKS